jgi:hypothetical protein
MNLQRVISLTAIAALVVCVVGAAEAQDRRVEINNGARQTIVDLYAWRVGSKRSNTDILQGRTIAPGSSVTINFANSAGACKYNVRAVFANGTEQPTDDLDVCQVGELNYTE